MASRYGKRLMVYVDDPFAGSIYEITSSRWVRRLRTGHKQWRRWYRLRETALDPALESIRDSTHKRVIVDSVNGHAPRTKEGRILGKDIKPGKKTQPSKENLRLVEPKPLRLGARYVILKEEWGVSDEEWAEIHRKSETLARERGDRMIRGYYAYIVTDREMPPHTKRRWEYFQKHGKEMSGGGGRHSGRSTSRKAS